MPRRHGRAAIAALAVLRRRFRAAVQASEFRTVAADELWIHFTWVRDEAVAMVEEVLAPFEARPHWGKVFLGCGVGERYERFGDFMRLRGRMDPERKFGNGWLEEVFGEAG